MGDSFASKVVLRRVKSTHRCCAPRARRTLPRAVGHAAMQPAVASQPPGVGHSGPRSPWRAPVTVRFVAAARVGDPTAPAERAGRRL